MITHPEHIVGYAVVYINPVYQSVEAVSNIPGEAVYDACEQSEALKAYVLRDYAGDQPNVVLYGAPYEPLRVLEAVDPIAYDALADEAVSELIDWIQRNWQADDDGRVCLHDCEQGTRWDLYALPAAIPDDETDGLTSHTLEYLGYRLEPSSEDGSGVWIRQTPEVARWLPSSRTVFAWTAWTHATPPLPLLTGR